eukprot:UN25471
MECNEDFLDIIQDSCEVYEENDWCTKYGNVGAGWNVEWGALKLWANEQGEDATVCPQCGCNLVVDPEHVKQDKISTNSELLMILISLIAVLGCVLILFCVAVVMHLRNVNESIQGNNLQFDYLNSPLTASQESIHSTIGNTEAAFLPFDK